MKEFYNKNKKTIISMIGGLILLTLVEFIFEYFFGVKMFGIFSL